MLLAACWLWSCTSATAPQLADSRPEISTAVDQQEQGKFAEAEMSWLAIEKKASASKDKSLLNLARYWLVKLYCEQGQYQKAIPLYEEYLTYKDSQRGDDEYRAVSWNQAELGDLYYRSGKWSTAAAHYNQALEEWTKYGRTPETISILHKLALCNWKDSDAPDPALAFEAACKMYDKMLYMPGLKERRWRFDVDAALMLEDYARFLAEKGDKDESQSVSKRASNIWKQLSDLVAAGRANHAFPGTSSAADSSGNGLAAKEEILKQLAERLCHGGRHVEALKIYDTLFEQQVLALNPSRQVDSTVRAALVKAIYRMKEDCLIAGRRFAATEAGSKDKPGGAPGAINNPYWTEFQALKDQQECFDMHQQLCHKYAWAIPNQAALDALKQNQPIIEIGAGTGYWAYLLRQLGVKIAAYDLNPVPSSGNQWHRGAGRSWTTVLSGDETAVRRSSAQTLFLCWPPEVNRCAYNALRLFNGNTVIYVGEGPGGCSGTAEFHNLLARDWDLVGQIEIPQWPGVYDGLYMYMRKRAGAKPAEHVSDLTGQLDRCRATLGADLAKIAEQSHTVIDDLTALLDRGVKVRFVPGPCRAFFDQKSRTINIASSCSSSRKLLAISHEYAHALLNPTAAPSREKISRQQFIERGLEDESDAVIHELVVARELKSAGITLDKSTERLLSAFDDRGSIAVTNFLNNAQNSATDESYVTHFGRWYDEVVKSTGSRR